MGRVVYSRDGWGRACPDTAPCSNHQLWIYEGIHHFRLRVHHNSWPTSIRTVTYILYILTYILLQTEKGLHRRKMKELIIQASVIIIQSVVFAPSKLKKKKILYICENGRYSKYGSASMRFSGYIKFMPHLEHTNGPLTYTRIYAETGFVIPSWMTLHVIFS